MKEEYLQFVIATLIGAIIAEVGYRFGLGSYSLELGLVPIAIYLFR